MTASAAQSGCDGAPAASKRPLPARNNDTPTVSVRAVKSASRPTRSPVIAVHVLRSAPSTTLAQSLASVTHTRTSSVRLPRSRSTTRRTGSGASRRHSGTRTAHSPVTNGMKKIANETIVSYGSSCHGECAPTADTSLAAQVNATKPADTNSEPNTARPSPGRTGSPTGRSTSPTLKPDTTTIMPEDLTHCLDGDRSFRGPGRSRLARPVDDRGHEKSSVAGSVGCHRRAILYGTTAAFR